jgi:hypothetical protein
MIRICSKREKKTYFEDAVAGGISDENSIALFMLSNMIKEEEECAVQILNHEVLHQVLGRTIDKSTMMKLDNIQKPCYLYDYEAKKWSREVIFIFRKKNRYVVIV